MSRYQINANRAEASYQTLSNVFCVADLRTFLVIFPLIPTRIIHAKVNVTSLLAIGTTFQKKNFDNIFYILIEVRMCDTQN